jgi:ubiquinone/menaquinone biosynthesis C-methylase UbiE
MHKSAFINAKKFYDKYCNMDNKSKTVLDVGSWDGGNGSLKEIFSQHNYIGLDMQQGPNVNIVSTSYSMPFDNNSIDIIVSSSCFEHDPMFWITFLEMCRILKDNGYIYICAPSSGPYHPEKCPGDSWRFYPDSWRSLSEWANINNYNIKLLESYIDNSFFKPDENWKDSVGIFQKLCYI